MTEVRERQRRRRARLSEAGLVDATVTVPRARVPQLRTIAKALVDGHPVSTRLIPALQALKRIRTELEARGVTHAGVFGSTARGDDEPDSDVDIVLSIDLDRFGDALDLMAVSERIEQEIATDLPGVQVDVADLDGLRPGIRPAVESEVVYAF